MLDVYRDPHGVTSTKQWSRLETTVRIAKAVCCAEVLFQPSFLYCLWETRQPTRWLWYGLGTEHAAYHGT